MQFVSPGFFETLGIPIPLGRDFTDRDVKDAPPVAIVNEKFVKRYFGDQYPIGRRIGMGGDPGTKTDITIIGVVRDTKYENLRAEIPFQVYRPYQQVDFVLGMTAYLRARGDPSSLFPTLRRAVREVDANVPVSHMRTLKEQVDVSLVRERLLATLSTGFGLLASLLAAVGLYGVMGYMVARRTREIGIRMALGASSRSVIRLVMREVLLLVGAGVGIGLPAAWALTRLVETQLYAVAPSDPWSVGLATAGIAATALLAGYFPARRAMQVDPMRALRWE
jgi:predicted permease